ncbi:hypothetical protein LB456_10240 [Psychroflexus sp. CAK57W]|uniref:hypothetical protein n=1 Tax=Psychroflexus curvus TaxID=2873595 RepID=UPI001CCB3238|nr:hypothetical protein [Psychroflexus curvus]MBZ9787833.1 hypothetical protein [Psychroflexus curvus]
MKKPTPTMGFKNKKDVLGLVIVDGVGFRNFILSNFFKEANQQYEKVVIFSGLPKRVYSGFVFGDVSIEELDDFKEPSSTWFFRKIKEIAHLRENSKNNFGISDNLKANHPEKMNRRGLLTRFIYLITYFFHSEYWIDKYYSLQQWSFKTHSTTQKYDRLLKMHSPDVLFFTHQRPPYIAPLIYAANKQGIATACFIFSWDNLASKGRMAGDFDKCLVWSKLMEKELLQFYPKIKPQQIQVVGTPQFEPYVMEAYKTSKEIFYKKFDLDREYKTLCYSCGDISTSKNDELYIATIAKLIQQNSFDQQLNFLVRTSPAEDGQRFEKVKQEFSFIKWNTPEWVISRENHSEPWSQRVPAINDMKDLRAILNFCDVGINMCSTMSLDFMHFNKPVINPVFGNENNGLYNDGRFLNYAHYKRVAESGSVSIAKNKKELKEAIVAALEQPLLQQKERNQILDLQLGKPLEGTGTRIANALANE